MTAEAKVQTLVIGCSLVVAWLLSNGANMLPRMQHVQYDIASIPHAREFAAKYEAQHEVPPPTPKEHTPPLSRADYPP